MNKSRSFRIVPVILDQAKRPTIIAPLKYVDWRERRTAPAALVQAVTRKKATRSSVLLGVNSLIRELDARPDQHFGIVACDRCGSEDLHRGSDSSVHGQYVYVEYNACHWTESDEI